MENWNYREAAIGPRLAGTTRDAPQIKQASLFKGCLFGFSPFLKNGVGPLETDIVGCGVAAEVYRNPMTIQTCRSNCVDCAICERGWPEQQCTYLLRLEVRNTCRIYYGLGFDKQMPAYIFSHWQSRGENEGTLLSSWFDNLFSATITIFETTDSRHAQAVASPDLDSQPVFGSSAWKIGKKCSKRLAGWKPAPMVHT